MPADAGSFRQVLRMQKNDQKPVVKVAVPETPAPATTTTTKKAATTTKKSGKGFKIGG